jgi:hypothetical protein
LPQPSLFSVCRGPWSRSKEELDKQLRLLSFRVQHGVVDQEEEEVPADHYTMYHAGASSSSYQNEVLFHHILGTALHGRARIDLHLGQKPKLGGRYADNTLIYIYHILSVLCISMFRFLFLIVLVLISTFQNTKRPKIFPLFLFVCFLVL